AYPPPPSARSLRTSRSAALSSASNSRASSRFSAGAQLGSSTRARRRRSWPTTGPVHLRAGRKRLSTCSTDSSISASAPAPPKDRIAARTHEEPQNDQQHAEDDRARKEHHNPRDDKDYGDDPQDQTDVMTHGNLLTRAFFVSHPRPDRPAVAAGR